MSDERLSNSDREHDVLWDPAGFAGDGSPAPLSRRPKDAAVAAASERQRLTNELPERTNALHDLRNSLETRVAIEALARVAITPRTARARHAPIGSFYSGLEVSTPASAGSPLLGSARSAVTGAF
jgi:hypothetical protein